MYKFNNNSYLNMLTKPLFCGKEIETKTKTNNS